MQVKRKELPDKFGMAALSEQNHYHSFNRTDPTPRHHQETFPTQNPLRNQLRNRIIQHPFPVLGRTGL